MNSLHVYPLGLFADPSVTAQRCVFGSGCADLPLVADEPAPALSIVTDLKPLGAVAMGVFRF